MTARNCFMCVYSDMQIEQTGFCSSCAGEELALTCKKHHFDERGSWVDKSAVSSAIQRAATCPDFKPEGWAEKESDRV